LNRTLAIDYGEKKVGLALSDPLKIIAKPYKTVNNISDEKLIEIFRTIISDKNIDEIVIGLPLTMKNSFSKQTENVDKFIELLKEKINIKVVVVDERLSSIEAKKSLVNQGIKTGHNKKDIDMTAAALFLQSYLDKIAIH
tara:strand:+ start:1464 stop:1883 length:420 start_codon:yes stop_codon:yes gene_type:complete